MKFLLVTMVFASAGCAFDPSGQGDVDAPADDAAPETDAEESDATTADATTTDSAMTDAPVVSALCNAADPALRACFTFTGGTVTNGAGTTLAITSQNVTATQGPVGGAIAVGATSVIHIGETAALELVGPLTFEAFVRLGAAPPATGRAGVYDENGEWGMFINDQRQVYCSIGPVIGPALTLNTWTHVACVYDRANVILYVNGQLFGMTALTGDLNVATTDGGNLGQDSRVGGTSGDPMTGALDEVRIWATARTAAELAAAAARSAP